MQDLINELLYPQLGSDDEFLPVRSVHRRAAAAIKTLTDRANEDTQGRLRAQREAQDSLAALEAYRRVATNPAELANAISTYKEVCNEEYRANFN